MVRRPSDHSNRLEDLAVISIGALPSFEHGNGTNQRAMAGYLARNSGLEYGRGFGLYRILRPTWLDLAVYAGLMQIHPTNFHCLYHGERQGTKGSTAAQIF